MNDPKTLGDYLRDYPKLASWVASYTYNPGFVPTDNLGTADSSPDRDGLLRPETATQDLSVDSLKGLNDYANSLRENEENHPPNTVSTSPGSKRGDPILPSTDPGTFAEHDQDAQIASLTAEAMGGDTTALWRGRDIAAAKTNFDTLSGGTSADATLGSFFGADRLIGTKGSPALLSKTGAPGEPSANYLLKNRSLQIGKAVEEVLDKTNRYSPNPKASPYLRTAAQGANAAAGGTPNPAGDAFTRGLWSVQTGQGVNAGFDPEAPHMNLGALRAMASRMMLEASGEYVIDDLIGVDDQPVEQFISILAVTNLVGINPANIFQTGLADLWEQVRIINVAKETGDDNLDEAMSRLKKSHGGDGSFLEGIDRSGYTIDDLSDFFTDTPIPNLNSWAEPFAGMNPIGMFGANIIGLVIIAVSFAGLGSLFNTAKSKEEGKGQKYNPKEPTKLAMGMHRTRSNQDDDMLFLYLRLNGFPDRNSNSDFKSAMLRGMKRYYGMNFDMEELQSPLGAMKLLNNAVTIAMSPGYYATMNRIIIRDIRGLLGVMADALGAGAGGALGGAAIGLLGGTEALKAVGIHKSFQALGSSTIFNFMKICVVLGDIAYDATMEPGRAATGGTAITYGSEPLVPAVTAQNRLGLSRFWKGPAVSPSSPLSLHLQNTLLLASKRLGAPKNLRPDINLDEAGAQKNPQSSLGTLVSTVMAKSPGRFDSETVRAYEVVLDKEYTPFYLHDLRTNELIAFPAFISSVSDSFSPEYTETHGYGRTDPVRTYAKTTRTIDMTFVLAAMNPTDMDYMWFAINKLVAMCYPQRSVGRVRTYAAGTGRFVQPFSQVPTASPVVRLRLGELFHSNYSIDGLKRLFGVGTPGFNPAVDDSDDEGFWEAEQKNQIPDMLLAKVANKKLVEGFFATDKKAVNTEAEFWTAAGTTIVLDSVPPPPAGGGMMGAVAGLLGGGAGEETTFVSINLAMGCTFKILDAAPVEGTIAEDKSKKKATPHAPKVVTPTEMFYQVELKFPTEKLARFAMRNNTKLEKLRKDLTKVPALIQVSTVKKLSAVPGPAFDDVKDGVLKEMTDASGGDPAAVKANLDGVLTSGFFNEKNAIVRSFRASAGRGLAGVITSMAMNYDAATWGTEQENRDRAPKKVEVTIGFAPIHDLPLGLDSEGELIAPAYPVGSLNTDPFAVDGPPVSYEAALQEAAEKAPDPTPTVVAANQAAAQTADTTTP